MGSYDNYKRGRDMSWEVLIKSSISTLPVALDKVAKTYGIKITSFKNADKSKMADRYRNKDVFADVVDGVKTVFVNNEIADKGSVRFSMAKGIGICLLSDDFKYMNKNTEYEAGIFARDLLMPAVVLYGMNVRTAEDIEKICGVSYRAAELRAERMAELYGRRRFNTHPLEQKVWKLFENFITQNAVKK